MISVKGLRSGRFGFYRTGTTGKDMMYRVQRKKIVMAAIVGALLTGCAVGPNFKQPEAPKTQAYTAEPLSAETPSSPVPGGASQRLIPGEDIPGQWWTLFRSSELDQVINHALEGSPTLAAAKATLRQAQENLNALVGSALYPQVDARGSVSRQKISGAAFGQPDATFSPFTLYNASVNVTYAFDLFGGARRELEALQSQVDFQRFQLEAAYLTITANIVTTAVKEALLRAELSATRDIISAEEKQFKVTEEQFRLGGAARPDVLAQQTQLAQTRATLPPLEKELSQTRHQLAVLMGKLPSETADLPRFTLDELHLPVELPVSLPSSLARQRPDIRAAEALLHAANAQVGVATANLYPQLTLSGNYGSEAVSSGSLFKSNTGVWGISGGLLQPLFHGGELKAKRRAAVAAFDQAAAQYRATILLAFQNVADVLRALDADATALKAQADADASARDLLELTQKQFQLGAVSYLTLLNAERQYQQTRIGLVQAQALRFADTAALFQALGGGWWNRNELKQDGQTGSSLKE
jgi:NodT family efflux transporter outer membrane factor (OMF) lipoprotein